MITRKELDLNFLDWKYRSAKAHDWSGHPALLSLTEETAWQDKKSSPDFYVTAQQIRDMSDSTFLAMCEQLSSSAIESEPTWDDVPWEPFEVTSVKTAGGRLKSTVLAMLPTWISGWKV